jgi:hypothetical protein
MRHLSTLIAAVFVAPLFMVAAAASVSRWRRWPSAAEPAKQAAVESPGPSLPAPEAEPEPMTRYASKLRSGNTGPKSYAFLDNSNDRWALNSKVPWPYAQRP